MVINIDSSEQSRARLQLQLTPGARAPPRPTSGKGGPSRPTPRPRALPRLTPRPRAPPRPTLGFALCLARPLRGTPPRPTLRSGDLSRPTETHTVANHPRSKRMGLGQSSNTREVTDMPRYNLWPCLGIPIRNSIGRTGAVLPNLHTSTDRRISLP